MKVDLLDVDEFVKINHLREVTSPVLFQRGDVRHPDGLISDEIFGITTKDRKQTFAYIDLHGHYFAPHVYKVVKFLFSNIDSIIDGSGYYSIKNGKLIKDEDGFTGIGWLYDNWEKINWRNDSPSTIREERVSLLEHTPKNIIFMTKQIVIPPFYRDISSAAGGGGETSELNRYYTSIIRYAGTLASQGMFDFSIYSSEYSIQQQIVNIYEYFKSKLEKKQGMIRKYLMGKSVTYSVRSVITASPYHANDPDEAMVSYEYCGIPISQLCGLVNPFLVNWLKLFFEREFIHNKFTKQIWDPNKEEIKEIYELESPETYFTDKFITKMIDNFVRNPECRFDPIMVPIKGGKMMPLAFTGEISHGEQKNDASTISNRKMTVTDLLFVALVDIAEDKHALITRYPLSDSFNIFTNKIHVASTTETMVVKINNKVYDWYPIVDETVPKHEIGTRFVDSLRFSNAYLQGLNGDFDGDQVTVKIVYTQEANKELDTYIKRKSSFLNVSGDSVRNIGTEAVQTFYVISRGANKNSKMVTSLDKKWLLEKKPEDFTFAVMTAMFADLANDTARKEKGIPYFNVNDKLILTAAESPTKSALDTTVGRYVFYKVCIERSGLKDVVPYPNYIIDGKGYKKIESTISEALLNDKITTDTMIKWIDYRDWFGLQLHAVICTSFTPEVIRTPKEVVALKKELMKKYEKELAAGDPKATEIIEKALIAKTKEVLKDNPGLDIYMSGARGNLENNYKNMNLMRGAIKNPGTGEYDVVMSSLMDGMEKEDIPASSNIIISGAYPKSIATADTGYMSKEILAALQTEILDKAGSDCGTIRTIPVTITERNKKNFLYRYIKIQGKIILLNDTNINNYVGKEVQLRSPLMCKNKLICNVCAGDLYYKLDIKNAGLTASTVATRLTNLNMKKFHDNTIKTHAIDIDDLVI